jgi:hypothetical protein
MIRPKTVGLRRLILAGLEDALPLRRNVAVKFMLVPVILVRLLRIGGSTILLETVGLRRLILAGQQGLPL